MTPTVRFDLASPRRAGGPGLSGLIAAADALFPTAACSYDLNAKVLLSGLAFRSYQLDPADNHALAVVSPDLRWATDAIDVDNYGALEALGGHYGVGPRTWRRPALADAVALVRHELDAGRPVVAELGVAGTPSAARSPRWALIRGVHAGRASVELPADAAVLEGADPSLVPVTLALAAEAGSLPAFESLTVVRPLPVPPTPGQRRALQRDVLVFGRRHLRARHELIHHADLLYAAGLRALARSRALVAECEGTSWQGALGEWMERWCSEQAWSRHAGAAGARAWADGLEAGDAAWRAPEGGAAMLRRLSDALAAAGASYGAAAAATTLDARLDTLSSALTSEHELADALDVLGAGATFG